MNKIIKWLTENGIPFITRQTHYGIHITIVIEPDCVWINGFGKEMHYEHHICIGQNTYKKYEVVENTGYARSHVLFCGGKADNAIKILAKRFDKEV